MSKEQPIAKIPFLFGGRGLGGGGGGVEGKKK